MNASTISGAVACGPRYSKRSATTYYHGTRLDVVDSILRDGPKGDFYVTPSRKSAEYFGRQKTPWFGTPAQKTVAVLELTPKTNYVIVAEPALSRLPNGAISAQYPTTDHYEKADIAWNPEYRHCFLTPRGVKKFEIKLPERNIVEPGCFWGC